MNASFLYFLVMLAESIKYTKLRSRTTGSMLCCLYSHAIPATFTHLSSLRAFMIRFANLSELGCWILFVTDIFDESVVCVFELALLL